MTEALTETLGKFIRDLDFKNIPNKVVDHAKYCILDWVGAATAGSLDESAKVLNAIIGEPGKKKEATIVNALEKTSCLIASFINGFMSHIVEMDDVHFNALTHPGVTAIPPPLALGEFVQASGQDLITAVILGYEIETRIGIAINPSHYRFWHTTGTCGTFGATAGAAKILGLGNDEIANAFGIAGTMASGLIEVFGTMSKPLNPGRAAFSGVLAALLAQKGFTGPKTILEGERGFCRAASTEYDLGKITEELGKRFEIMNNGFKLHASCGLGHAAIDAVLALVDRYDIASGDVEEVMVGTYRDAIEILGKNYEPRTAAEGKFSLPYCVAVALMFKRVRMKEFTTEILNNEDVRNLAKRVKFVLDPEIDKIYPRKLGAKVKIRVKGGKVYEHLVDIPKGNAGNPATEYELQQKFMELATLAFPKDTVKELQEKIIQLEKNSNISELTELLRPKV